ncbi:uncharacterized protein LOC143843753 isoform X1 [Paroedura picta]|uniref:uncharacterized protein LOC143843753 isoform X1 n=1 Tax=Paroedura picta TaxID=143630 RepID=UPI0040566C8A
MCLQGCKPTGIFFLKGHLNLICRGVPCLQHWGRSKILPVEIHPRKTDSLMMAVEKQSGGKAKVKRHGEMDQYELLSTLHGTSNSSEIQMLKLHWLQDTLTFSTRRLPRCAAAHFSICVQLP